MAENDNVQRNLRAGIQAAREGNRSTARRLLTQVVNADPRNELGWIWLASVTTSASEKRTYLERVLTLNPNNTVAKEAMLQLGDSGQRPTQRRRDSNSGGVNLINILLGVLVAVIVVGGLAALASINDNNQRENNQEDTRVAQQLLQQTQVSIPTTVPTARRVIVTLDPRTPRGQTLPATFTPTPSPTPTLEPTATENPFPVEDFTAFYTSLAQGESAPSLFQINGDGSNERLLAADFRDIAFDPGGQRIAFIRDVEFAAEVAPSTAEEQVSETTPDPNAEPTSESSEPVIQIFSAPELFIAEINDLANAVQITDLRSSILSSPTWSPEGTEIVFTSNFDGDEDLWYVTPDGNNLRNLMQELEDDAISHYDPAWSPILGSRQLLFVLDGEIYSMELVEPGVELTMTQLTNAARSSYAPQWAPNGEQIVFVSDRRGDPDIYLMNPDGTNERSLIFGDGDTEDRDPSFTPDGNWVAFVSNREDDHFQSYLVSLDGQILTRLTNNANNDAQIIYQPDIRLRVR